MYYRKKNRTINIYYIEFIIKTKAVEIIKILSIDFSQNADKYSHISLFFLLFEFKI